MFGRINFIKLKFLTIIIVGFLLIIVGCSFFSHSKKYDAVLNGLERVKTYAVVYSKMPVSQYSSFDLLILEGENYSKFELDELKQNKTIVLAYLNIGEIETYRSYFNQVNPDWFLQKNEDWPDHFFINPSKKGWRNLLIKQVIPNYLEKGFQGFLFDSVDLASQSRFPAQYSAMVKLISFIHKKFPQAVIILNNGEFLLPDVANQVHGLLLEEVFTQRIDANLTKLRTEETYSVIVERLAKTKSKWKIPTFVLEYFPTNESIPEQIIFEQCEKYGFIPYITDQYFQNIYKDYFKFKEDHGRNLRWSN